MSDQVEPKENAIFGGDTSVLTKRESLAVELAERIAGDPHTVTSQFWQSLKEEFTDDELVEMVFACGIFNWGNKFNITMQLDTDGTTYERGMEYKEIEVA